MLLKMCLNRIIKIGDTIISTNNHLKKASSRGCISFVIYLPKTTFPAQNKTQNVNKKYVFKETSFLKFKIF